MAKCWPVKIRSKVGDPKWNCPEFGAAQFCHQGTSKGGQLPVDLIRCGGNVPKWGVHNWEFTRKNGQLYSQTKFWDLTSKNWDVGTKNDKLGVDKSINIDFTTYFTKINEFADLNIQRNGQWLCCQPRKSRWFPSPGTGWPWPRGPASFCRRSTWSIYGCSGSSRRADPDLSPAENLKDLHPKNCDHFMEKIEKGCKKEDKPMEFWGHPIHESDPLLVSLIFLRVTNLWKPWIPHKRFESPLNMKYSPCNYHQKWPKHPVRTIFSSWFTASPRDFHLPSHQFSDHWIWERPEADPVLTKAFRAGVVCRSTYPDTNPACRPGFTLLNLKPPSLLCSAVSNTAQSKPFTPD